MSPKSFFWQILYRLWACACFLDYMSKINIGILNPPCNCLSVKFQGSTKGWHWPLTSIPRGCSCDDRPLSLSKTFVPKERNKDYVVAR